MSETNPTFDSLQEVKDIRRMMERSSRFTSLSGLSFVAAGICALVGAWLAYRLISSYYGEPLANWRYSNAEFSLLKDRLLLLAAAVFGAAAITAFYFTWRKARRQNISLWDYSVRKVFWAMAIPLGTGAVFIFEMLMYDEWRFVAPGCLVFYGLALANAGRHTVADIRYLGYLLIIIGLVNMYFIRYGLQSWILGFGVLHIIYGIVMWWKYERRA